MIFGVLVILRNESSFKLMSVSKLRGVLFCELYFKRVWKSIFGNFVLKMIFFRFVVKVKVYCVRR